MHAMADMFAQSMGMSGMPSSDDASKKIRKPYTITKARESWTEQEHDKFLEALQLFDRDWKKIEAFVASKTVIQIRSHAQKYFQKVQKNGTGEHVPPPRPKRKSAQPYPQKASKALPEAGVMGRTMNSQPTQSEPCFRRSNFPSSSMGSSSGSWQQHHSMPPVGQVTPDLRGDFSGGAVKPTPDFAEVYKFIGKVFDMDDNDHLRKMKEMAPIDREAVLLLMRNLTLNLSNPEFEEEQRSLLPANVDLSELGRMGPEYHMPVADPSAAQAGSDGGDDDTAVSGQPGPNQLSECPNSDAQLDPNHQRRGMPSYSMWDTDESLQHDHFQDTARGYVGCVQPMNTYSPLVSPRPLDMSSLARHRMMGAYSHPHLGAFNGGMGYAMPLPALTAGVESHLDGWMY